MKANNSLRINMPRALELIFFFFPRSWSDLSDIRLIRVRHNEKKLYIHTFFFCVHTCWAFQIYFILHTSSRKLVATRQDSAAFFIPSVIWRLNEGENECQIFVMTLRTILLEATYHAIQELLWKATHGR